MIHYNNFSEILLDKKNYPNNGRVFVEKLKFNDLKNSNYWIISRDEAKRQEFIETKHDGMIPISLKGFNVKMLLPIARFQDIIEMENNELSLENVDLFFNAIINYLENNEDFIEYEDEIIKKLKI